MFFGQANLFESVPILALIFWSGGRLKSLWYAPLKKCFSGISLFLFVFCIFDDVPQGNVVVGSDAENKVKVKAIYHNEKGAQGKAGQDLTSLFLQ